MPLSPAFPAPELQYILGHSEALLLLSSPRFTAKAQETLALPLAAPPKHVELTKHLGGGSSSSGSSVTLDDEPCDVGDAAGMMLYTSGTTNRPKGVLLPEAVITAQARSLLTAWEYSPADRLLHVLPLHHIHGTINAILTPLFAGSSVEFLYPFNADAVWRRFGAPFLKDDDITSDGNGNGTTSSHPPTPTTPITFFTVVPTVYSRLLQTHKLLPTALQTATRTAISPQHLRLAISGSAALPTPIKHAWATLSHGNVLLERFGMTEVGMALSCGLHPSHRVDGAVGWPLPGVEARLVDPDTTPLPTVIAPGAERDPATGRERSGEIQLRGPTVFRAYWRNAAATASEFVAADPDDANQAAWFKTGDVAVRRPVTTTTNGTKKQESSQQQASWTGGDMMYFILGRKSADIIKSGGEKVSALEVERELLSLPEVAEAAVLAVPSGKWGQKVGAVVILNKENFPVAVGDDNNNKKTTWSAMDMRRALKGRLVAYKIPQVLRVVDHIPRNAMGKINKKQLVKAIFQDDFSGDEM